MLGFGALGQFPLGGGPYGTTTFTTIGWYNPLSDPVRFVRDPRAAIAVNHQTLALYPKPIVSFSWFGALTEPVRQKPGLLAGQQQFFTADKSVIPISRLTPWFAPLSEPVRTKPSLPVGEQQFFAFNPRPFVSFSWFNELSKPQKLERIGLASSYQQTFTFNPLPRVSFAWFGNLSEPVRVKPGLTASLQQFFTTDTAVIPISKLIHWFANLSEPVRIKLGVGSWLQQFLAAPARLLPTPTITGTLSALETKDTFLAGAVAWNKVTSAEIGVIDTNVPVAEIGVSTTTATGSITSVQVSIRIV